MTQHREHFYMVSATVQYVAPGKTESETLPKQHTMNIVMQLKEKKITASTLNSAKTALFDRMITDEGIPQENLRNIIFNTFSHLGFMTQGEFQNMPAEAPVSH